MQLIYLGAVEVKPKIHILHSRELAASRKLLEVMQGVGLPYFLRCVELRSCLFELHRVAATMACCISRVEIETRFLTRFSFHLSM